MSKAGKVVKITLKTVLLGLSLFVYAFFMFRLCTSNDPKTMTKIVWNDINRAAYLAEPDAFEALDQEPQSYITADGHFWISNVVYLPQAKQLQLTIKYNDSTKKALTQELEQQRAKTGADTSEPIVLPDEPFVFTLSDNNGTRYTASSITPYKKQNYNYRRLVFDGVDFTDGSGVTDAYADIYYIDSMDDTKAPYGSLKAWDVKLETIEHNIKKELPNDLK
ncbi:MAG: hypothetical protein J6I50_06935 [Clostridia bacterium]|nr:hypothetical protein [Clostridia bacterium]